MDSPFIIALPLALAVIMLGVGLSITSDDFIRVFKAPKAVIIALGCQMLLLPLVALGLVEVINLEPALAVGVMLLVASPGGTTANLFSHLAGGDVALNVTLTAINSVLAMITLPIVVGWSLGHFMGADAGIGLQPGKLLQVFAVVLVPVALGMAVNRWRPEFARRMEVPVKRASVAILTIVVIGALAGQWDVLTENLVSVGSVALLLSTFSLAVGYWVPTAAGVTRPQAISSAMEIGIHNATLAITVALSVLDNEQIAIPPAVYGVVMFLPATLVAVALSRRQQNATHPISV
jgi:BASS family bile acid:Na+ symporter